jgi:hypothetical protein
MQNNWQEKPQGKEETSLNPASSGSLSGNNTGNEVAHQVKQLAQEAVHQTKEAASIAVEQVTQAVYDTYDESKQQVTSMLDKQKSQVVDQFQGIATVLRRTGEQLAVDQETTYANYVQSLAGQIEVWADFLHTKNLGELVDETKRFAYRQPELFIVGSLAAGLFVGRFLKSSENRQSRSPENSPSYQKSSTTSATGRMNYEGPLPRKTDFS